MENSNFNGNLNISVYEPQKFSEEDGVKIEGGEYPIILAKGGVFTKHYISEDDFNRFTNWDATDTDVIAQRELHGINIPIVWEADPEGGMFETGITPKDMDAEIVEEEEV